MKQVLAVLIICTLCFGSVSEAKTRSYKSGGRIKVQKGYYKPKTGKFISPHLKTSPDGTKYNNLRQ